MEPLDEQADERDHAIHPENNTEQDPVEDTDEQFKAACILLKEKELFFCVSAIGQNNHRCNCVPVCVIKFTGTSTR